MSKKPLVSIIVPVYNVAPYLLDCFSSLVKQTYKNLEIILIDDGSTDASKGLCEKFAKKDHRVVLKRQANAGLSATRNVGLTLASGDYIFFLDSDDFLEKDAIEYLVALAERSNSPIAICPHFERRGANDLRNFNATGLKTAKLSTEEALKNMLLERGFNLQVTPKLYVRALFEASPKIRFPKNELHEDVAVTYKLFLRAYQKNPHASVAFGAKPKYFYNIRNSSITNRGFDKRKLTLISRTDEMCDELDNLFPDLTNATNLRRLHARFSILRQADNKNLSKVLVRYIKEHKTWITKNPEAGKRDKLALISLRFGLPVFRLSWRTYELFFK